MSIPPHRATVVLGQRDVLVQVVVLETKCALIKPDAPLRLPMLHLVLRDVQLVLLLLLHLVKTGRLGKGLPSFFGYFTWYFIRLF